jgi:mono/diheme cytochrome c family protein
MKRFTLLTAAIALAGLAPSSALAKVDFVKQIQPILKNNCYECHGPEKKKGGLRLDSKEAAFEEDYMIQKGNAKESELYIRVSLPADHDDIMPPKGGPLKKDEIDLIQKWIQEGAEWPEGLAPATVEKKKDDSPLGKLPAVKPSPEEAKAIAALSEMGVSVRPIARDLVWKTASLRSLDVAKVPEALKHLAQVKTLSDLNLASRGLKDGDLKQIAGLTHLTRLHLENNDITDAGLKHLAGMAHLDYLNLYGTQVSNAGLATVKAMKDLRKVYLWQTKVDDSGVEGLKKALPNVDVVMGWNPAPMAKAEEKKEEKKPAAKKDEKKAEPKKEKPAADKKAEKKQKKDDKK